MKTVIVIGGDSQHGADAMSNTLCICDCILKDKKDGDDVEATIKGVLIDHGDGKRYIAVSQVDGEDVVEEDTTDLGEGEQPNDVSPEDLMNMDTTDALDNFMKQRKQNANTKY